MQTLCDAIQESGHAVLDNFLPETQCLNLKKLAQELNHQGRFQQAKIGRSHQNQQRSDVRGDHITWLDEYTQHEAVQDYLNCMQNLGQILNQTLFLGLQFFESHFAVYPAQTFYKKHRDQFQTTQDRRISCVFYLNETWESADGGELVLYDDKENPVQVIEPRWNRLACFTSDTLHEVLLTHQQRWSITGWFKVKSPSPILHPVSSL